MRISNYVLLILFTLISAKTINKKNSNIDYKKYISTDILDFNEDNINNIDLKNELKSLSKQFKEQQQKISNKYDNKIKKINESRDVENYNLKSDYKKRRIKLFEKYGYYEENKKSKPIKKNKTYKMQKVNSPKKLPKP